MERYEIEGCKVVNKLSKWAALVNSIFVRRFILVLFSPTRKRSKSQQLQLHALLHGKMVVCLDVSTQVNIKRDLLEADWAREWFFAGVTSAVSLQVNA